MSKDVSAPVLTNMRRGTTSIATLVRITRADGVSYLLTNHDQTIVYEGEEYRHDIPFVLSAVSTNSQFAIDNMEMNLAIDGDVFKLDEFKRLAFQHAEVQIMEIDFLRPLDGAMTLRRGWFGSLSLAQYGVARITIVGLLKILDIEIGRVYQPSCDADLGDSRCKIAIDFKQIRDYRDIMRTGEWRYIFNPAAANAITLINPSFEDDGEVLTQNDPITGWTRVPSTAPLVVYGPVNLSVAPATQGTHKLHGRSYGLGLPGTEPTDVNPKEECHIYQNVDLTATAIDPADIDAGRISLALAVDLIQTNYLLDPPRLMCELRDEDDNVISVQDTGSIELPDFELWRTKHLVFPLLSGTRSVRVKLMFRRTDGFVYNAGADNVRLYWWDHIDGNPWDDVIHKVARIADLNAPAHRQLLTNGNFEQGGTYPIDTVTPIPGWQKVTGPWGVAGNVHGVGLPTSGSRLLSAGNDGSGTQQTYEIRQDITLTTAWGVTTQAIDLGRIVGAFFYGVLWGDAASAASVVVEWYNALGVLITQTTLLEPTVRPAPGSRELSSTFVVPVNTRTARFILRATSPVGDSLARIGFDNIYAGVIDSLVIKRTDPVAAGGDPDTVFSTSAGSYTFDGALLWKAHTHHVQYDVVGSVTNRKQFFGTDIEGIPGSYETGLILWISGQNRGQKNMIRVWDSETRGIKLYFESVYPIQPGDRFQYIRSCQKRFSEDCQLRYDNIINFRGFPHLPGRVSD